MNECFTAAQRRMLEVQWSCAGQNEDVDFDIEKVKKICLKSLRTALKKSLNSSCPDAGDEVVNRALARIERAVFRLDRGETAAAEPE